MKRLLISLFMALLATSAWAMMKPGASAPDFTLEAGAPHHTEGIAHRHRLHP